MIRGNHSLPSWETFEELETGSKENSRGNLAVQFFVLEMALSLIRQCFRSLSSSYSSAKSRLHQAMDTDAVSFIRIRTSVLLLFLSHGIKIEKENWAAKTRTPKPCLVNRIGSLWNPTQKQDKQPLQQGNGSEAEALNTWTKTRSNPQGKCSFGIICHISKLSLNTILSDCPSPSRPTWERTANAFHLLSRINSLSFRLR